MNHCRICGHEKTFKAKGSQRCKVCFARVCVNCIKEGICLNCKEAIIEKPKDNDIMDIVIKSKCSVLPVVPLGAFPKHCGNCKYFRNPHHDSYCGRDGEFGTSPVNICWCFERR